jgi:predicted Fe-Mo cluster-binding NifX family protein
MRIAVSADNDMGLDSSVSHHFGRCPFFVLADVDDGEITQVTTVENPFYTNHRPGEVPAFIQAQGASVIICGGMGRRAIAEFSQRQIDAATGGSGTARTAIQGYMGGDLREAAPCKESVEHAGSDHSE